MEANDMVEMRGVLEKLRAEIGLFYNNEWIPYDAWQGCDDMISHALAKPPRNCDIGDVDEQERRYRASTDDAYHTLTLSNVLEWEQMPYAQEGGAK